MSFRNRCQIAGAEGVISLAIPLVGGRGQKGLTRDVRIAGGKSWQAQHWKTIVSCYSRSPWFDYYRDGLETLFQKPVNFLMDWNQECLEWTLRVLGMPRTIRRTAAYREVYLPGEGADWRGRLVPRDREKWGDASSGLAGGAMDVPGAATNGRAWPAAPRYRQVFEERIGFTPNLSILDLLFCEGKEAIRYIRSSDGGKLSEVPAGVFPG